MPHTNRSSLDIPLCAKEVATMLGCSYRVVLKLIDLEIHPGQGIKGWRNVPGGRWHFSLLEIQLYIEKRKIESKKERLAGRSLGLLLRPTWLAVPHCFEVSLPDGVGPSAELRSLEPA
jgi:hypothetical protein